jgi:hypothetical protein
MVCPFLMKGGSEGGVVKTLLSSLALLLETRASFVT